MAEDPGGVNQHAANSHDRDADPHERTLTDLIDQIEREAFSRSLAKRPAGSSRSEFRRLPDE